jgi:hypothetical protein
MPMGGEAGRRASGAAAYMRRKQGSEVVNARSMRLRLRRENPCRIPRDPRLLAEHT